MTGRRRAISFAFCFFCLTVALQAQSSPPAPKPVATANTQNTQPSPYQLSVKVNRVVVDVAVTDAKGNPVEGLKQEDFKVMEDGADQAILFFDAHTGAEGSASRQMPDLHLPPNTFTNLTPSPVDRPVTILFYDMLDTPEDELPFAHDQLVRFIKDRKDSSQIAIFALTDRLHMLQGFTDDETRLIQAINLKKATAQAAILRDAPLTEGGSEALLRNEIEEIIYHARKRSSLTVEAFIEIARFVSALPGRKNLIWLSGTFPREIFLGGSLLEDDPPLDSRIRAARTLLSESRVVLYPVDIRGLQTDSQYSAANLQTIQMLVPPPSFFDRAQARQHVVMDGIAETTGGRAFYNTNGLKEAMDAALRQGSNYYSLTYAPSEAPSDGRQAGREHSIKVVLDKPGYQLSYRKRYLAPDSALPTPARPLLLDASMRHGTPNSSELFFVANVVAVGTPMSASPQELQALARFPQTEPKSKQAKPESSPRTVQHYNINFALVGRQLEMPALGDGRYATDLRFGMAAYAEDSELLNGTEVSVKNSIPEDQLHKIESDGYHASMLFAVPEDAVSLRMAVRDEIGSRIGTIEIPLPLQPAPAAELAGSARHDPGDAGSPQ